MPGINVAIFVDYESPLARRVAGNIWSGLARGSVRVGRSRTTAFWESLRERGDPRAPEGAQIQVFVIGQDEPEAVEGIGEVAGAAELYGIVVAVPERPSPLAGSLLYQGVERLTGAGVRAGAVEPALLHAVPEESESYARRLLERLRV